MECFEESKLEKSTLKCWSIFGKFLSFLGELVRFLVKWLYMFDVVCRLFLNGYGGEYFEESELQMQKYLGKLLVLLLLDGLVWFIVET